MLILKQASMHSQTCTGIHQTKQSNFGSNWNMGKSHRSGQRRLCKLSSLYKHLHLSAWNNDHLGMTLPNSSIISCLYFITSLSWNYNYSLFFSDPNSVFFSQLYSSKILTAATQTDQTWPKLSANKFAIWVAHSKSFKFQKNQVLPNVEDRLEKYEWQQTCCILSM